MIRTWLLLQLRRFKRNKANSIVNVFGLSLGIFVFLLIGIYVRHEFSYDKFHKDQNQIFQLIRSGQGDDPNKTGSSFQASFPGALQPILKSEFAGIEAASRLTRRGTLVVETDNHTFVEDQFFAGDHDVFEILTFDLRSGNLKTVLTSPQSIVISESTALKYFGTVDVLGKSLVLTSNQQLGTYSVDAVFKDFPKNSSFNFNLIVRFEDFVKATQPHDLIEWNNWNYNYFVKLGHLVDPATIEGGLPDYLKNNLPAYYRENQRFILEPIHEMYHNPKVSFSITTRTDVNRLYLLTVIAFLVLTIAIINYINLSTAQSFLRAKEVGIRKVTGAQRTQLVFQFLGDTLTSSLIALSIALIALKLCWPVFQQNVGKEIPFSLIDSWLELSLLILLPFGLSFAAGMYPALTLSAFNPVKVLKGTFARSQEGSYSRDILMTIQFAISGGLVIAVIIVNMQLNFIQNSDPGYSREHIITIPMADEGVRNKKEAFQAELLKNSSISNASMSTSLPHAVGSYQNSKIRSGSEEIEVTLYHIGVDYNYLDLFNIQLLEGRNFSPESKSDNVSVIINETAAMTYGWDNPVGMVFTDPGGRDTTRIIGVMKDIHFASYHEPIKPLGIRLIDNFAYQMSVRVSGNDIPAVLKHIESSYKKFATSKLPYKYSFFDETYDKVYKTDYQLAKLINTFSCIAVIIAALGLYSISIHSANLRLKEIGVRKVLGAQITQIAFILSRKFFYLIMVSFLISVPCTFYIMREWLTSFAYHVSINGIPFILSFFFLLLVSILTISVHTLKTAALNPVDILRSE